VRIDAGREGGSAELQLAGRLDREGAEQLSQTLEYLLQDGVRSLTLDLSEVTYVSSAATVVLSRWRQELTVLRGDVRLVSVPPIVREGFAVAGWDEATLRGEGEESPALDLRQSSWHSRSDLVASGQYDLSACVPAGQLSCRLVGRPDALAEHPVGPGDCEVVELHADVFALGLGAIGTTYQDCQPRLGELVAAGGCVACFPSDGARMADFLAGGGRTPPRAVVGPALICTGGFSHLIRFSAKPEARAVLLSEIASVALEATGSRIAGLVIAAETAGLAGARLRRSPAGSSPVRFDVPAVRDWLSFAPEPIYPMATTLIVGVVARRPTARIAPFLRPLGELGALRGHFHAAVFSYHALPQRTVELAALVRGLFASQQLRDVLHLLWDPRGEQGVAESGLVRGVGWVGPITQLA
jgi:anti-anti-sigma factor